MKLRDVYAKPSGIKHSTKLKTVGLPMQTVQKNINQKPPLMHKSFKKIAKRFKKIGRLPKDSPERYERPIPPVIGGKSAE